MSLTKAQREARAENERVLARNYPLVDVVKLQNELFLLAIACERNALNLCNDPRWTDQRDALWTRLECIARKHKIRITAKFDGDPRGYCLKLLLPDGSYNSWGGKENGYGIGSI